MFRRSSSCDIGRLLGRATQEASSPPLKATRPWWIKGTYLASIPLARMNGNGNESAAFNADHSWAAKNLNTIMLAIVLCVVTGGLGALGKMGWDNSMTLAEMKGNIVTKQELDLKIAAVKADIELKIATVNTNTLTLEKDLYALKLALAERGINQGKK